MTALLIILSLYAFVCLLLPLSLWVAAWDARREAGKPDVWCGLCGEPLPHPNAIHEHLCPTTRRTDR